MSKTPRKGQTWATDFGREVIKLTGVTKRNVYYQTPTGAGWMLRSRLLQEWSQVPKGFEAKL